MTNTWQHHPDGGWFTVKGDTTGSVIHRVGELAFAEINGPGIEQAGSFDTTTAAKSWVLRMLEHVL